MAKKQMKRCLTLQMQIKTTWHYFFAHRIGKTSKDC